MSRLEGAEEVFVPSIALGELYYGARKSAHPERNAGRVSELASATVVLDIDAKTAQEYGRIKAELRTRGKPIPENDIWIASIAAQHGLVLITRDQHFLHVQALTTETW